MFFFKREADPWSASEFQGLPRAADLDHSLYDWALITGGLALVLSRCSPRGIARDFKAAETAYRSLRRQSARGRSISLAPGLLNDVRHEVAQFADPGTRDALRRRAERATPAATPGGSSSAMHLA
jgi:hypothetical protein